MSQNPQANNHRATQTTIAGISSFVLLSVLFIATMLVQYSTIDFPYLSFALLRIFAISVLVSGVAYLAVRHLHSRMAAWLFGAIAGFLGGVAFVATAA